MSDLLDIVEAAYAQTGEHADWLQGLAQAAEPHLQHGWGVAAFHLDSEARVIGQRAAGVPATEVEDAYAQGERVLEAGAAQQRMMRAMRDAGPISSVVATLGEPTANHDPASIRDIAYTRGARDVVCLTADTLEEDYVGICALRRERWTAPPRVSALWARISAHIGAGLRIRRKVQEGDIVATPNGRIEHAGALAEQPQALEAIRQAVRGSERARGPLRHDDLEQALELWQALVSGRWSLVDHFDADGRRYILARENAPNPDGPTQLTPRQRTAVKLRARGHSLKFISYELGLSVPTVSLELREALRVLGVRSVLELGAIRAGIVTQPGDPMNPRLATSDDDAPPASGPVAIQDLDAPSDLRAITFQGDGARYIMLSFPVQGGEPAPQLTAAEREVLQAVLDGRTNASIARERGTAVRTVANQVAALFRKFGASSRLDLARRASSLVVGRDRL